MGSRSCNSGSNTLDVPPKGTLRQKDVVAVRKRVPDRRQEQLVGRNCIATLALSALPAITPDVHLCRSSLIPTTIQRVAVCICSTPGSEYALQYLTVLRVVTLMLAKDPGGKILSAGCPANIAHGIALSHF